MSDENAVRELENNRIKSCCARDRATMDKIYDASMTHVHMNGLVENRDQLIDGLMNRTKFQSIERPDLKIRITGDVAVITGPMQVRLTTGSGEERSLKAQVTQVAKKGSDGWRFMAFHATQDTTQPK